jgi:CotH kinase protein/Chitobiase/beta-hexosaminidase C-terminal domain/Lamin Tail Domain/FlgD Ig-like domain
MWNSTQKNRLQLKGKLIVILILVLGFSTLHSYGQDIVINEVVGANSITIFDEDNSSSDWIELFNWGDTPVDLNGFGISNKKSTPLKWIFPSVVIPAKGFLVVFVSGKDRNTIPMHTNFKISASGEFLAISNPSGVIIDSIRTPSMITDVSYGRIPDGSLNWTLHSKPTPGAANKDSLLILRCQTPEFSRSGGFYSGNVTIDIASNDANAKIYYSLDGSEPTTSSVPYSTSLEITKTSVLRARSFTEGLSPSLIATETYLINENITLPVVSVTTDPNNLWDKKYGIYIDDGGYPNCNSFQDWERPVNIEYIEKSGKIGFQLDGGVKIHGGLTRIVSQKALNIYAKKNYGTNEIDYKLFEDKDISQFKSLVLRNGGNDYKFGIFRDPMMQTLVKGQMGLETPAFNYVIHYLNGKFWGIECLQEKFDKNYVASNNHLDADSINLLEYQAYKSQPAVTSGSADGYNALIGFVQSNDLSVKANYDYVSSQIDIDNFINYNITEIYIDNGDWPGNNIRLWNSTKQGSKWRWLPCDLDFGFGLSPFGYLEDHTNHNTLVVATQPDFSGTWPNPPYSTLLLRSLCTNAEFSRKFINNFCDHLNSTFLPSRVKGIINSFKTLLSPEIARHKARFPESAPNWNNEINVMLTFADKRANNVFQHLMAKFQLQRTKILTFNADSTKGQIQINTLLLNSFPWSGKYFPLVPVTIAAIPKPGHKFNSWSDGDTSRAKTIDPNTVQQYTAYFDSDSSTIADQIIGTSGNDELKQNYPNPFSENTTIEFQTSQSTNASLMIINVLGQVVKTLANQNLEPGFHSYDWDGTDQNGTPVKGGLYFYQLRTEISQLTRKLFYLSPK